MCMQCSTPECILWLFLLVNQIWSKTMPSTDEQDRGSDDSGRVRESVWTAKNRREVQVSVPQFISTTIWTFVMDSTAFSFGPWPGTHTFRSLFKVAIRLMAVPESSAPVEHVFSHRSQLSNKVLYQIKFLQMQHIVSRQARSLPACHCVILLLICVIHCSSGKGKIGLQSLWNLNANFW